MKGSAQKKLTTGRVRTPFGAIKVTQGLPASRAEIDKIFQQLDFQQASQAYLWALPLVSWAEWQATQAETFGATDHDIVLYTNYAERLGILTANATTPYMVAFFDLNNSGPMVIELPPGPVAGGLSDFWQREGVALGEMGPDRGAGGRTLVVAPGSDPPADTAGYRVVTNTTVNAMFGLRALDPDAAKVRALVKQVRVYPYSTRANPPATRLLTPKGKWFGGPPRGMDYWKRLHAVLQDEVIEERDRFYLAMLANLGIEKGKPFKPDSRQKKALMAGAVAGELMAQCNSFAKRFAGAHHWKDRRWVYLLEMEDSSQRTANFDQLLERAAYTYEAVGYSSAMKSTTPGLGQGYLGAYTDKAGNWLDGGKSYGSAYRPTRPRRISGRPRSMTWARGASSTTSRAGATAVHAMR